MLLRPLIFVNLATNNTLPPLYYSKLLFQIMLWHDIVPQRQKGTVPDL